jgi:hypothetical protein
MTNETSKAARLKAYLQSLASHSPPAGQGEPPKREVPLAASAMAERGDLSPPQAASAAAPPLTLDDYSALVAKLPRPTEAQMMAFATFVCGAHSWYKHLPMYPPGKPIQFFLDPGSGMDLNFHGGRVEATPRLAKGFHYSWIPTHQYRERFGHLAFSRSGGTTVYSPAPDGTATAAGDDVPSVYDAETQSLRRIPPEVLEAGRAWISGLVHAEGASPAWLLMFATQKARATWPEESGGPPALTSILARCEEREDLGWTSNDDEELIRLLAPERKRQHDGMVDAMLRVAAFAGLAPPSFVKTPSQI